jgi:hypothetical protein
VEAINAPARAVASAEQRPTAARVDRLARHHLCPSGPIHSAASTPTVNPGRGLTGRVNSRIFPHRHCRPRELPELEKIGRPNRLSAPISSLCRSPPHHASPRPSRSPPRAFPAPPLIIGTTPLRCHRRSASARHHNPRWVGESIPLVTLSVCPLPPAAADPSGAAARRRPRPPLPLLCSGSRGGGRRRAFCP